MNEVKIFSDGACFGNPGPGAFATLIQWGNGDEKVLTGFEPLTTNNRMELMGVIAGLEFLKEASRCHLVTDSQYVSKGISEWLPKWIRNHWRSKVTGGPIKNLELWQRLNVQLRRHRVDPHWVRGHTGHPENERCNELAQQTIREHT
jgi:ribonuclease HI